MDFSSSLSNPVLLSDMLATWVIPLEDLLHLHSFYLAFYLLYKLLLPSSCYSLSLLTPLPPFIQFGNISPWKQRAGRNTNYHTHHVFTSFMGCYAAFSVSVVRKRKHEENVYTRWELPELVLLSDDREGAIVISQAFLLYPQLCGNRYLHVPLYMGSTSCSVLTPHSVSSAGLVLLSNRFIASLLCKLKMNCKRKKKISYLSISLVQPNIVL